MGGIEVAPKGYLFLNINRRGGRREEVRFQAWVFPIYDTVSIC